MGSGIEQPLTVKKPRVKQAKDCDCITQIRECAAAVCTIKGSVPRAELIELDNIHG